ncbi:hypothetical protein D7Z26_00045 [Cohnella endophytica]|uniref:Uncharacterized protein n=1 Tax=Cohnella endophytica TaxID=2419778 RepID=A0A494Y6K8_9BACL|nr:hypothetical protein [Cohnella endophytica]RKP57944.1 hypothetical protein D7Z26_00045 [Cohnella endophytica]
MAGYISTIISFLVISFFMNYATRMSNKIIDPNGQGEITLKLNRMYSIVGYVSIVFFLTLEIIFSFSAEFNWGFFSISSILIILGIILILGGKFYRIILSSEGITQYSFLNKYSFIKWDEITQISFNSLSQEVKVRSQFKGIKIHTHMVGFENFIEIIKTNVEKKLFKKSMNIFQ